MARGLDAQQQIFASRPEDRRAFEALEEHFFLQGDWDSLADVYRKRIAAPGIEGDLAQQSPLLFRLGQILEERLLDLDAACEVYWTLARLDPGNRAALRQLRGIHESREQWDMVLQIAELEGATDMPAYERAAFETELGRTWLRQLHEPEQARLAFERALEAAPDCAPALEGLAELHQDAGRFAEAAALLEQLTGRLRGPERAPIWIALGTLLAGPLADRTHALECFSAALEDDPLQSAAVEWSLLLATEQEDWPAVAELLERRFDLALGARHRAAIAVEASQIHLHHLNASARARAWIGRALELTSDEASVLLASADVERADGDADALLKILDQLIAQLGESAPRSVLIEAAELHARFEDPDAALEILRRAGDLSSDGDLDLLRLQAELLRKAGSKRELAEVLETLTALDAQTADAPRAEQLRELAQLYEEDLADEASALPHWRAAFAIDPRHEATRAALERFHRKHDDWASLRDLLEQAVEAFDSPASAPAALSVSLGTLCLERFEDLRRARTLFEAALESDSGCPPALAGLRRIAEERQDADLMIEVCEREAAVCDDPEQMAQLARDVLPILEERRQPRAALDWAVRWSDLDRDSRAALEIRADYEQQLDLSSEEIESRRRLASLQSGPERSLTLRRQAELHLEQGDDLAAASVLELALDGGAGAGDLDTLQALGRAYRRLERPQDLARVLRQLADLLPEDEREAPLAELAELLEDPIGDLDAAIVVRWQLAELPNPPESAASRLESLLERLGRYAELAHLLESRRQQLGDETDEALVLDLRRGRLLLDSLGHAEEAATLFSALHERHPEDDEILDLLERALRIGDDARGLCTLLERRVEWTEDSAQRIEMQLERAQLLEDALGEPIAACDLYETIIHGDASPAQAAAAAQRLEFLLEASGEWHRLRAVLISRLEETDDSERPALRERIANLCRDRLHDAVGCAEQLEAIAAAAPESVDESVWQQLEAIYAEELDRPGDWLRVVEAELASEPDPARERALRVGAARLLLDDARRPADHSAEQAHAHYQRVLELDPMHAEAAEVLISHFNAAGEPDAVARVLESRLAACEAAMASTPDATDAHELDALRLRLAGLYADELDDDLRARPLFERVRRDNGAKAVVAEPLLQLLERAQDFDAASALCRQAMASCSSEDEQQIWRIRLAANERRAGHLDDAAIAYRAALVRAPDDRELEDALCEIYTELGETEPLIELYDRRLAFASQDECIELHLQLARLYGEQPSEAREALRHLEAVLAITPHHRDALERALATSDQLGDVERILSLLEQALALPWPSDERADLLERRADRLAEQGERRELAVAHYREALSLDRNRASARKGLRTQLEVLGRWPAVLDCLFVEASLSEPARRCEIYEEAAEIARVRIGSDAALPWLARLREENPEDPEIIARIAEVHRRAGRFEAALRALDAELALRSDPRERAQIHTQRARLLERDLHAPSRAIGAYQQALVEGDRKDEIRIELDRLYDLMGRPLDRARILEERLADLDPEAGRPLRETLATLYAVELARPQDAIPHLQLNLEQSRNTPHDPRDEMQQLGALGAALRACARHDAWSEVAERELALIEDHAEIRESTPPEYARFLREELARVYDEDLGDSDRAIAHLRALTAGDPSPDLQTAQRLQRLLRRTGRTRALADQLSAQLVQGQGSARDWLELARLREESLHDLSGALQAYHEAVADPELARTARRGQRRCCERLRDWPGLAAALEATLEAESQALTPLDRRERAALARKLGDVCWQRLASKERALAAYRTALELDERDRAALAALIAVHEACRELPETVPLYQRELEWLGDDRADRLRRREIWLTLARLQRDACQAPTEASLAYCAANEIERLSAEDELALARLYQQIGDAAAFEDTYARWCDRDDSTADVSDHLTLARQLLDSGRNEPALARALRATAVAPEHAPAWALVAELERAAGAPERAAEAFERAADHADAIAAAGHRVEAAACIEALDAERALSLLRRASELDPASLAAHCARTRVASHLGHLAEAARAAETALELADAETLPSPARLEVAVLGGRAAREDGLRDVSRRLFQAALSIEADHIEALEGVANAHFEAGDVCAARPLLERRIELPGPDPQRATHLAMLARGLEADTLYDAAWSRYEEALELDAHLEVAHEGLVRIHERAARPEEALEALERWSGIAQDDATRASTALRAAEHALALQDAGRARRDLEQATHADPQLTPAWVMLCELAADRESERAMRRLCREALEAVEPSPLSAQISLRAAKLAEVAGDLSEATERYAEAWRWDPRCREAALCESRLTRMSGDWVEADDLLARFTEAHPDRDSPTLAQVHLERGRLLSGPLERFEDAIREYERALELQPELGVARTALAGLLTHAPDRWREALAVHRELLTKSPTTSSSLRALVLLAERHGQEDVAAGALTLLQALGQASPQEADRADAPLRFPIHPGPPMAESDAERLRRIAHQLSEELANVLAETSPDSAATLPECEDAEVAHAIREIFATEDDLTAPGLSRLDAEERRSLFTTITGLFLDPGGNGGPSRYRDALDRALGRWNRRKAKRTIEETTLAAVECFDYESWGSELRAMAAAQVIDRHSGDLRAVLRALIVIEHDGDTPPAFESAELGTLASNSDAALRLLTRITSILCERLERSA